MSAVLNLARIALFSWVALVVLAMAIGPKHLREMAAYCNAHAGVSRAH